MRKLLVLTAVLFLSCSTAFAVSFETGWTPYVESGTIAFDPAGEVLHATASTDTAGAFGWGNYSQNFAGDYGTFGTFNVSSVSTSSNEGAFMGLRQYMADTIMGNKILAELYLQFWDGQYSVRYRVRERTQAGVTVNTISRGFLGDSSGTWSTSENIRLAMALRGNHLYFWSNVSQFAYVKVELFDLVTERDDAAEIFISTEGNSSIAGTVSSFDIWTVRSYIPHITSSAKWTDYLRVDNNSGTDATYMLTLYDSAGQQLYSDVQSVSALSGAVVQPKQLAAGASSGVIMSTNKDLFFRYSYVHTSGGVAEFSLKSGYRNLLTQAGFYFNSIASIVQWKGLAIANYSPMATNITMYAYGSGGYIGSVSTSIPGYGKIVGVHTKWFPGVPLSAIDRIIVVAENNLTSLDGIVIAGSTDNSSLLFTNAADASGFIPPAPLL